MTVRNFLALLSAIGLLLSIVVYIESLTGATFSSLFPWPIILAVGIAVVHSPIFVLERRQAKRRTLIWRALADHIPPWALNCAKLIWLVVLAHFVWLFIKSHGAAPAIADGQWVLSSHGRIVKILTEEEYLMQKAADLTVFAIVMIASYMTPMLYWWFTRKPQAVTTSASD